MLTEADAHQELFLNNKCLFSSLPAVPSPLKVELGKTNCKMRKTVHTSFASGVFLGR